VALDERVRVRGAILIWVCAVRASVPGPARAAFAALCAATLLCAAIVAAAPAAAPVTKRTTRTFALPASSTRTFAVGFPDALKFGSSTYGGDVTIRATSQAGLRAPALGKVKVLRQAPALGGSVYQVTVSNANPFGTAPVSVIVTAITHERARSG